MTKVTIDTLKEHLVPADGEDGVIRYCIPTRQTFRIPVTNLQTLISERFGSRQKRHVSV